jgi:hypothetical protein
MCSNASTAATAATTRASRDASRTTPGTSGVGPTLRSGRKASYCLLDSAAYDLSIPGASAAARYLTCNTLLQGISVGWMDTYGKNLPGQDIDITGLPDGDYWLETEIDPDNVLLEKDETNNTARVRITINNANGTRLPPDAFEPNNTLADVQPGAGRRCTDDPRRQRR